MSENRAFGYTSIGLIAFAGIAVVLALLFMPTQADDVYFLNSGSGGGETTECINLASQYQIVLNSTGGDCFIRALANGTNISITTNSTHVIINSTSGGETTVCAGQTGNYNLVASSSGGNCSFKNLLAGTGITLSSNSTHITITNSAPDNTTCANVGSGEEVYKDGECNFRTLIGSSPIVATENTNDITLSCPTCLIDGDITGYEELCYEIAVSSVTDITCTLSSSEKNLYIIAYRESSNVNTAMNIRFNSDTGNNYAQRRSIDGGADATATSNSAWSCYNTGTTQFYCIFNVVNIASKEKIADFSGSGQGTAGAGNAPVRTIGAGKWANTSNAISSVTLSTTTANTFGAGSFVLVLGRD